MYVAKIKALISFAVTAKLICVFVFAYAKCWFSHDAAQMFYNLGTWFTVQLQMLVPASHLVSQKTQIPLNFNSLFSWVEEFGVPGLNAILRNLTYCCDS